MPKSDAFKLPHREVPRCRRTHEDSDRVDGSPKLTAAKVDKAVALVLAGLSHDQVARQLDVHRTTVWRLVQRPEVARRIDDARRDALTRARNALINSYGVAVATVVTILTDHNASDHARLRAAEILLRTSGIGDLAAEVEHEIVGTEVSARETLRRKLDVMIEHGEIVHEIEVPSSLCDDDGEASALAVVT